MIEVKGSSYPRVTKPWAGYDLEYARVSITCEGATINFCENSQKGKGIEGHISIAPDDIVKIVTHLVEEMSSKIARLTTDNKDALNKAYLMEYEKDRVLEAACDLLMQGSDYQCETYWQARDMITQRANEIRESKLRDYQIGDAEEIIGE